MKLAVPIVLYQNNIGKIKSLIDSFKNLEVSLQIYMINNLPSNALSIADTFDLRCVYIKNPNRNNGFVFRHNVAIRFSQKDEYSVVINPDTTFVSENTIGFYG